MTSPQGPPDGDAGITPADSGWRWTFRRKLNVIAVIVMLTALIAWLIAYQTTRRMAETTEYVARVQESLVSVRDAADALGAAEAAQRASLLNAQDNRSRNIAQPSIGITVRSRTCGSSSTTRASTLVSIRSRRS